MVRDRPSKGLVKVEYEEFAGIEDLEIGRLCRMKVLCWLRTMEETSCRRYNVGGLSEVAEGEMWYSMDA
jgi:hypothetical protein